MNVNLAFLVFAFGLPALLMLWRLAPTAALPWVPSAVVQTPGLLAKRWFFFAQATHPQSLYCQVVS